MSGMPEMDGPLEVVTFRRRGVDEIAEAMRMPEYGKADVHFVSDGFNVTLEEPERPAFEGNRRARRKAAAQARKGVYVMPPIRYPEPKTCVPPGLVAFFEGVASMAESAARSDVARELAAKAMLAAEHTAEWMRVRMFEGGRIIDTATPEQRAAREVACAEEWRRIEALEQAAEQPAGKPAPCKDRDLPAVGSFA